MSRGGSSSSISERVQQLRNMATPKVTLRELDRLTGLREGHVAMLEKRSNTRVEARTISLIAEVFGVSMEWLYRGRGRAPSPQTIAMPLARARRASRRQKPRAAEQPTGTAD